jgi:hypothetical protein
MENTASIISLLLGDSLPREQCVVVAIVQHWMSFLLTCHNILLGVTTKSVTFVLHFMVQWRYRNYPAEAFCWKMLCVTVSITCKLFMPLICLKSAHFVFISSSHLNEIIHFIKNSFFMWYTFIVCILLCILQYIIYNIVTTNTTLYFPLEKW